MRSPGAGIESGRHQQWIKLIHAHIVARTGRPIPAFTLARSSRAEAPPSLGSHFGYNAPRNLRILSRPRSNSAVEVA